MNKKYVVDLQEEERATLQRITRSGKHSARKIRWAQALLKADDGELHLGNTTLVALDHYDDVRLVRAFERLRSRDQGVRLSRWDAATASDAETLERAGILGAKDVRGGPDRLFSVQGLMAAQNGALWQLYTRQRESEETTDRLIASLRMELAALQAETFQLTMSLRHLLRMTTPVRFDGP